MLFECAFASNCILDFSSKSVQNPSKKEIKKMFQAALLITGFTCLGVGVLSVVLFVPHLVATGLILGAILTTLGCLAERW